MRWSERQAALLAEMGIRLWPSAPAGGTLAEAERPVPAPAAAGVGGVPADRQLAVDAADPAAAPPPPTAAQPPTRVTPAAAATAGPLPAPTAAPIPAAAGALPAPTATLILAPAGALPATADAATAASEAQAPTSDAPVGPASGTADLVGTLDWTALQAMVAGCTACTLCRSRTQTVFGVGHPRAHWMVVGEAPGEQEDRQGEPFVGRSGQLLDGMLRAIGLSRGGSPATTDWDAADPARHVYIANTLKCRPPGNRNPAPDELARCEGYLIRQIELVQPKMILAMGRFAVQSLLRSSEPIGRLRGRVHRYHGVPLVVTYHPAYLLRNLPEKARAWDDLCLALDAMPAAAPSPGRRSAAASRADGMRPDHAV